MPEQERARTMLRAVELYYRDGLTQAAIADRLGCTRWTVGRLLKDASDSGMVTISVHHPLARRVDLEEQLTKKYDLRRCRVVPTQTTQNETLAAVARQVGDYLSDLRPHPTSLAVGWGQMVAAVAHAIRPQWSRGVTVAQVDAAPETPDYEAISSGIVLLAKKGRGAAKLLYAPPVGRTVGESEKIMSSPQVAAVLASAGAADVLLFSPHIAYLGSHPDYGRPQADVSAYVLGHWLGPDGDLADRELDGRTIALRLQQAKEIKHKIAACHGEEKRQPLISAISAGLVDSLVTDSDTADYLVAA